MLLTLITSFFILGFLVFIHEFGHFILAKRSGVKVEEFGFGYPPKIWGKKIGETEYSINLIPFGGFVRIFGENEQIEDSRSFSSQSKKVRIAILSGGSLSNIILGIFLFTIFLILNSFSSSLILLGNFKFPLGKQINRIIIAQIAKDSPAEKAGFLPGDTILKVGGKEINTGFQFVDLVGRYEGKELEFEVERFESKEVITLKAVPRENPPEEEGPLGVEFGQIAILRYRSFLEKICSGLMHSVNLGSYTFFVMGIFIKEALVIGSVAPVVESISGPVGVIGIVREVVSIGRIKEVILELLNISALVSLGLGIFNFLPIPAADGGRVLFVGLEAIFGKRIHGKFEYWFNALGFAFLIGLMFVIGIKDFILFFR